MPWVFDASIAAAWCFENEQTPQTESLAERLDYDPGTVPALFLLEIANVLTQAIRKKIPRITSEKRSLFLKTLSDAQIIVDPETNDHAWSKTIALADKYSLSTYDAAYLELAIRLRVELATLDRALRTAAVHAGVTVIP